MKVKAQEDLTRAIRAAAAALVFTFGPLSISQTEAFSQTTPTYDLNTTIQLALKSSNQLAVADRNLDSDAAAAGVAEAGFLPQISTTDTYQHLDSPVSIPFKVPGSPPEVIVAEAQDKEFLAATASLPLDITGRIKATTDAAKLQYMADTFVRDRIADERILEAQTDYFNLLRAEHQLNVANASLQNAQTQEDTAQRQFQGGIGQKIDYLRAQTQVAAANQSVLSAQNALDVAKETFNDLIGAPLGGDVQAVDAPGVTTGDVVNGDINSISAVEAPSQTFYTPSAPNLPGIDDGIAMARKQRPELLQDEVNVQASAKQIKIARTGDLPSLSLSATGDYYPTTDFGTPRHSLGVYAVTLSWPLYDGGATADRVREAEDTSKNAASTLASDQTTVELQVRQAYANLTTAQEQIASANAALQEAIAARELAQVRYANGVGLYLEVTDAESALVQAETDQVNAVYDYLTARANYENAIGAPTLELGM